jgi:hypothetical protein
VNLEGTILILNVRTIGTAEADVKSAGGFQVGGDASMSGDVSEMVDIST